MSGPWTFEQRLAAYQAEGISKIVVMPGARTHNRDASTGRAFGPVYGVLVHHTAGVSPTMADYIYSGVSALPGPLAQDFLAKDGTLYVVGHGRANHAGTTTPAVLQAIINDQAPSGQRDVGSETVDANDFLYGLEIENKGDGKDPYPAGQYDVAVRWAAAHLRHHRWSANSAWGHKEITRRKIDPSFDMNRFRADVRTRLNEEEEVALTTEDLEKIFDYDTIPAIAPPYSNADWDTNKTWSFRYAVHAAVLASRRAEGLAEDANEGLARLEGKVDALAVGGVDLDALAVKVADELYRRMAE